MITTVTSLDDDGLVFTLSQNDNEIKVKPIEGMENVVDFYNTYMYLEDNASKMWLYSDENIGNLSLVIHHNSEGGISGGTVKFDLAGVPDRAYVAKSDDNGEFDLNRDLEGSWTFGDHPDGGIIGGLPTDSEWSVTIDPDFISGIDKWEYLTQKTPGVESIKLDMSKPVTISFRKISESNFDVGSVNQAEGGVKIQSYATRVTDIALNSTTLHPRLRGFVY